MTDEERRDDAEIQDHLKKVYGFSEEQLLKEVERAEKSVSDSDFPGAEERIFQKLMERKAKEEKTKKSVEKDKVEPKELLPSVTEVENPEPETKEPTESEEKEPEKKKVRFRKKGIFLAAAVAAILALMLGSTAIGEKNYFMRRVENNINHKITIDNDKNKGTPSKIKDVYNEIEDELNIKSIKLGYVPQGMVYADYLLTDGKAVIIFDYGDNKIYLMQEIKNTKTSIDPESDRRETEEDKVLNSWLKKELVIYKNELEDGKVEYSTEIFDEKAQYRLIGILEKEEFKKIVEDLNFY